MDDRGIGGIYFTVKEVGAVKMALHVRWMATKIWRFWSEFFKCAPTLGKPLNQSTLEGKWWDWLSGLTWESCKKDHPFLHWCSWCVHIRDANLKQRHSIAGLLPAASAVCMSVQHQKISPGNGLASRQYFRESRAQSHLYPLLINS